MRQLAGDLRPVPLTLIWMALALVVGRGAHAEGTTPVEVVVAAADGGEIHAHLYGSGSHAVVLAHGKVFDKESWQPLAEQLVGRGYRVLALDFRGYGRSTAGSEARRFDLDVLGAIEYLERQNVGEISLIGASMGGWAVGTAATECQPGRLHKVILLAPAPIDDPEGMKADEFLYIASAGEGSLDRIRSQFERAPEPKRLELLPGRAHAQHVFRTDQAEELVELILTALAD